MNTRAFSALVRKDLRLFFSDRRAVILTLAVPLALASFMAVIFGGVGGGSGPAGKIDIRIVDEDDSALTQQIIAAIEKDSTLDAESANTEDAREAVRGGKASVAVTFPKGFGDSASKSLFGSAERPTVTLLTDPTHSAEAGMVRGLLTQHIMENVTRSAFNGPTGATAVKDALAAADKAEGMPAADKVALKAMLKSISGWYDRVAESKPAREGASEYGLKSPFETKEETIASGAQANQRASYAHAFAGMVVQFVLFGAIELGVGILTERQRGLWRRLRAAPLSRLTLLMTRAVSGAIISLISVAAVFGFGMLVFGIRIEGNALGFALIAIAYALTASTLGLLIAALGKTPQAARGVSVLVVLLMVMLGGAWMPSFLFPGWLQKVTLAIPTRWAVDGFEDMTWRGFGLGSALTTTAVLMGFVTAFGVLALWRFRWDEE